MYSTVIQSLLAVLALLAFQNNAALADQHETQANDTPNDAVCSIDRIPREHDPTTTQFIFDISCNEELGVFRITGHGGRLSYAERKSGEMDPIRCQMMREGHDYGVIFNGEFKEQGKFEHTCDIGDGYAVRTVIDYTKGWIFTHKCPRYETRLSNLFDKIGLKEFYYETFEPHRTYALPYSTELELLENGQPIFVARQLQGFGVGGESDYFEFNGKTHMYRGCSFSYSPAACKNNAVSFDKMKAFKYLKKYGLSGLACSVP